MAPPFCRPAPTQATSAEARGLIATVDLTTERSYELYGGNVSDTCLRQPSYGLLSFLVLVVARTGFEPALISLRTRIPRPLEDRAMLAELFLDDVVEVRQTILSVV